MKKVPIYAKEELVRWIDTGKIREDILSELKKHWPDIEAEKEWPEELRVWVKRKMEDSS